MRTHHHLDAVGNDLSRRQNRKHSIALRNAVAAGDRAKFNCRTAGGIDSTLDKFRHLTKIKMPRNDLIPRIGNADDRLFQIMVRITDRFE